MKVMGINTCGTYKKAVKWFSDHNIEIEQVNLREKAPSKEEMKRFHELSGLDIKKFFNTSGGVYRELNLKNRYQDMSLDEIYQLLADHPMLIKRPLIVDGEYVRTGFKEEEYIDKWL
jgi:arsenate reductase